MEAVWSAVNCFQLIQFFELFDLKAPGNVLAFMDFYGKITEFEIIDFETILKSFDYVPEEDSVSVNF